MLDSSQLSTKATTSKSLVYVNHILVADKNLADIQHIKARLRAIFDVRGLGEAKSLLGMSVDRPENCR